MKYKFLSYLKDIEKRPGVLKRPVYDWLLEHERELDTHDDASWEVLRGLIAGAKRSDKVFSPSGATRCMRSQVIKKLGHEELPIGDPHTLNIFEDGKWRHVKWQMIFWRMGIVESMERFVSGGRLNYGGSTDAILRIPEHGRTVVDIKGANDTRWNEINGTGVPIPAHVVQVNIYMKLNKANLGLLWYENKNTNEVCEVQVTPDAALLKEYRTRQRFMKRHVKAGTYPPYECTLKDTDRQFRQCPSRLICPKIPVTT